MAVPTIRAVTMSKRNSIKIIGGGLAGAEAAHYLARLHIPVTLYEQRLMGIKSPAHHSDKIGELVCSNSLKNFNLDSAPGVFKLEGQELGSLVLEAAAATRVPAGGALAVDRAAFADYIDEKIRNNPFIELVAEEVTTIPEGIVIIATGPLTSPQLTASLEEVAGQLHFFDASAPLVTAESINYEVAYRKNRYLDDRGDYLNCPMSKAEYLRFYQALISAERVQDISGGKFFSGCMPLEVMAAKGERTLTFGPLKPRGLEQPGSRPYAVCQLRQDDIAGSLYALVGFQTNLTYQAQREVFRLIPGLEQAEFVRYGLMHQNTYLDSPVSLFPTLNLKKRPNVFIAGQLSGVEGYLESAFSGIIAAINAARLYQEKELITPPVETLIGALLNYITSCPSKHFQPMNINWGLVSGDKKTYHEKSRRLIKEWIAKYEIFGPIS